MTTQISDIDILPMRLLAFVLAAALRCFYPSPRYAKARSLLPDIVQGWTPRFHAPPVKVDLAPVKVYGQCRLLIFPAHMAGEFTPTSGEMAIPPFPAASWPSPPKRSANSADSRATQFPPVDELIDAGPTSESVFLVNKYVIVKNQLRNDST
jgi:hypothetical protein